MSLFPQALVSTGAVNGIANFRVIMVTLKLGPLAATTIYSYN